MQYSSISFLAILYRTSSGRLSVGIKSKVNSNDRVLFTNHSRCIPYLIYHPPSMENCGSSSSMRWCTQNSNTRHGEIGRRIRKARFPAVDVQGNRDAKGGPGNPHIVLAPWLSAAFNDYPQFMAGVGVSKSPMAPFLP